MAQMCLIQYEEILDIDVTRLVANVNEVHQVSFILKTKQHGCRLVVGDETTLLLNFSQVTNEVCSLILKTETLPHIDFLKIVTVQ